MGNQSSRDRGSVIVGLFYRPMRTSRIGRVSRKFSIRQIEINLQTLIPILIQFLGETSNRLQAFSTSSNTSKLLQTSIRLQI